jgi:hypothetical protein
MFLKEVLWWPGPKLRACSAIRGFLELQLADFREDIFRQRELGLTLRDDPINPFCGVTPYGPKMNVFQRNNS